MMRFKLATVVTTMAATMVLPAPARAAERLTDPQVTQLVENINGDFDRWKDDFEKRNMDKAVIRTTAGNVDVRKLLDDLKKNIEAVKDHVKGDNAAVNEVTALLRRASDAERLYATQPGPQEWTTLSGHLAALADAYGVGWPLAATATAQRKTDSEVAVFAKSLADASDRLRDDVLRAISVAKGEKAQKDEADRLMRELQSAAKQLETGLKEHRAVSADAAGVLELSVKVMAFARTAGALKPAGVAAMTAIDQMSHSIATAFRVARMT